MYLPFGWVICPLRWSLSLLRIEVGSEHGKCARLSCMDLSACVCYEITLLLTGNRTSHATHTILPLLPDFPSNSSKSLLHLHSVPYETNDSVPSLASQCQKGTKPAGGGYHGAASSKHFSRRRPSPQPAGHTPFPKHTDTSSSP